MMTAKPLILGIAMAAFTGGVALAASVSGLTTSEQQTWQNCQAMDQSAMNSNQDCMSLLDRYPNLNPRGNNNGTTGSISNGTGGMAGGGVGTGNGGSTGGAGQ